MDFSPQPASRRQWEGGVARRPRTPAGRYQYAAWVSQELARPAFCLSQREPGAEGDNDADEDMLAEDPPGEGDDHPGELVEGPEADELRIVEPTGNDVPVRHDDTPSRSDRLR